MGDGEEVAFNNFINALNDLAKGQKEIMEFMGRIAKKGLGNHNEHQTSWNNNAEGGSNSGNEIHSCTNMQSHPHLYSRTSRPTLPQFLHNQAAGQVIRVE